MSFTSGRTNINDGPLPDGFRGMLVEEQSPGFPAEYVYTRLRGRRAKLISNWKTLVYATESSEITASSRAPEFALERSVEGLWRALFREHGWVFHQMNEPLRRVFAPYFVHAELRTIFICLRSISAENPHKTGDVLNNSLLSDRFKAALKGDDAGAVLRRVEELLRRVSPLFRGIAGILETKGSREAEQEITNRLISAVLQSALHPVIRRFFVRMADARNILSLFASLRAGSADPAVFMTGGTVSRERLRDLQEKEDLFLVPPLVKQASGITILHPEPTQVEVALYRGLTKFARTEGRDPLGAGLILDYLWRCSLEVTNLSLLLAGKDLDREMILAELVQ